MKCRECKKNKKNSNFCFRNKKKKIRHKICKPCLKKYRKKYYAKNKKKALLYSSVSNKQIRIRNRQFVWDYLKKSKCIDCGEDNPIVLEFDHKEGSIKIANIANMTSTCCSLKKLSDEIKKCEIRCSNCHKIKTAERGDFYKDIVK